MERLPAELPKELKEHKFTNKQISFAKEYVIDSNATQAAIRAGYSENGARVRGSDLLLNSNVRSLVEWHFEQVAIRNRIDKDEIVQILAKMARFDIAEIYDDNGAIKPIHEISHSARMSIEGIDTSEIWERDEQGEIQHIGQLKKIKVSSRIQALNLLMKHLGMFEKDNKQKRAQIAIFQLPDNNR